MKTHDRVSLIGTRKSGEIESFRPINSTLSGKKLWRVLFDGARHSSWHSEDELLVVHEPARRVIADVRD